jgi:acyl-CoA thioesterase
MFASDDASKGLGIEVRVERPGAANAIMVVTDSMINGFDVCHGGYIFLLADSAFAFACNGYNDLTFAAGASVEFLRPVRAGDTLSATANEDYRGRQRGLYKVTVENQDGALVAAFHGRSHSTGDAIL